MAELTTEAERQADKSREFKGFQNLSLPGVKQSVTEILSMIGRVEGIFATYTKHDISHVDAMLEMLDWLVPPSTKDAMTPIDWLLIVLSIYLHDLGMVVSQREFEQRMESPDFKQFLDKIENDPEGKEYLDRAQSMTDEERERFFYQEYVRFRHPARIHEWVTGRQSDHWGDRLKSIADEIARMMADLPQRFREHLGTVCRSHHEDNLDNTDVFPLCERYGNRNAMANVQYAAVLLRTADLLHVTQDRTPSVMYKLVRISDLKGVDEWAKQSGTFSVNMKPRSFDSDDTESHVVVVKADLTEERPFFSLTEYIAYADEQIKQSKRWTDKSRQQADGKSFWLPWHTVEGNILVEGNEPQKMKFELDRGRLLDLLVGHTLYNEPTVAIRELLQNSIDAVRFQHHLDKRHAAASGKSAAGMGQVVVHWDAKQRLLAVEDDGIGMDFDTIRFHLMLVGASYYNTPQFNAEHADFSPISRFGIGILTCFMISDDIEIVTCRGSEAYRIRMSSVRGDYLLKKLEPGDPSLSSLAPHGTRVTVKVRTSVDIEKRSVLDIVRFWVVLPECSVIYREQGVKDARIGYGSVNQALQELYPDQLRQEEYFQKPAEIMISETHEGSEHYELGFLVRQFFRTEKGFVAGRKGNEPAVCVEGIRVDNRLPGFKINNTCALLSVRGNRRFRTTVSRTELERDAEYWRIACICADLLFDHIKNEVEHIATKSGKPLSQASSASRSLTTTLTQTVEDPRVSAFVESRCRDLPSVVVEEISQDGPNRNTDRKMISRSALSELPSLWTIESRIVDSLGIISRDLGRELSINAFLSALAPERCDPNMTPLVLEAELMGEHLLQTHRIANADFNIAQQQARICWELGDSWHAWRAQGGSEASVVECARLCTPWLEQAMGDDSLKATVAKFLITRQSDLELAPLMGDDRNVFALKGRVTNVLDETSLTGMLLADTRRLFKHARGNGAVGDDQAGTICAAAVIERMILAGLEGGLVESEARQLWLEYCRRIWTACAGELRETVAPIRMQQVVEELANRKTFNASSYWRDWK